MPQRFRHDFIDQLSGDMQIHSAILQSADRQQIFHQVDQPHRIVVDVHAHLLFGLCVKQIPIGEQIACIPGDRSQRGAQVVGDGPEQVGAQLFIFRQYSGSFLLLQILLVFQSEGAFPQDREQDAGLEGVQRAVRCGDSHDPVHQIAGPDG